MAVALPTPSAESPMRRIAVLLGWLSLLATLALLSPGVVATRSPAGPEVVHQTPLPAR